MTLLTRGNIVYIVSIDVKNYKGARAVRIKPPAKGALSIYGKNGNGKTSVLDAITETLRGVRGGAEMPIRNGEDFGESTIDLGDMIITRKWSKSGDKVTDKLTVKNKEGLTHSKGQTVLNDLLGPDDFDVMEFSRLAPLEQANKLGKIAGLDLQGYRDRRSILMDQRRDANRSLKLAQGQLDGMPSIKDPPPGEAKLTDLVAELESANKANETRAAHVRTLQKTERETKEAANSLAEVVKAREQKLVDLQNNIDRLIRERQEFADRSAAAIEDEKGKLEKKKAVLSIMAEEVGNEIEIDTTPIREQISTCEANNAKYRQHKAREDKRAEIKTTEKEVEKLNEKIDAIDSEITEIVSKCDLKVKGLTLTTDGVFFNGHPFKDASQAERIRCCTAIVLASNPKLRYVRVNEGSLIDDDGMQLLAELAEEFQALILIERAVTTEKDYGFEIIDGESMSEEPEFKKHK